VTTEHARERPLTRAGHGGSSPMSVLTSAPAAGVPKLKVTQVRVLRSEWTKFRSVRSTMWTLLIALVLMIGIGAVRRGEREPVPRVQRGGQSVLQPRLGELVRHDLRGHRLRGAREGLFQQGKRGGGAGPRQVTLFEYAVPAARPPTPRMTTSASHATSTHVRRWKHQRARAAMSVSCSCGYPHDVFFTGIAH